MTSWLGSTRRLGATFLFILGVLAPLFASGQSINLSPEQRRMLNQLPAAQRAAALQQLGNLQATQNAAGDARAADTDTGITLPEPPPEEQEDALVFVPGDTVVLDLGLRDPDIELSRTDERETMDRLLAGNPYELDELGRLVLPGVGEIALAGLTQEQATLRLNFEPALANFMATATRLPLHPVGIEALRPFGHDLFRQDSNLLSPNAAVPVAADYTIGVGDSVRVQLFGNRNAEYELPVDRNGAIRFPEIGPVSVAGLTYASMQELLGQRVREQFIGTQVSVTLGELRALQVFVVGDVRSPGSYAVSPMSTITTALARSGGIAEQGSMRRVQLKRNGALVQTLDVYDLLLRGDTRGDVRLRAGDVVFVPPVGTRVTVAGEVNRPAIYEYRGAADVQDAIGLAGGLTAAAYRAGVKIERFEPGQGLRVIAADQASSIGRELKISNGDTIIVPAGVAQLEGSITVVGNVQRPGQYQWRQGLRITDVIRSSRDLKENSDLNYLLIRREAVPNAELAVLSADVEAAWRARGRAADVALQPRDTVYVFDLEVGREHVVEPLLAELQLRSTRSQPLAVARIGGQVKAAGQYPLEADMRVADLVRAAGGPAEAAYLANAELTRYELVDGETRTTELISIDLLRALNEDPAANILLQSFDYLNIKTIPRWGDQEFVEVDGEVAFPGRYPIAEGETLTSVINRAGGLTNLAFPDGSIFTREALKDREREQLEALARRIESDLTSMSLSDPSQAESLSVGQTLLRQIRSTRPVGRLVVDLEAVLSGANDDLLLRDGDRLLIPTAAQEVTVVGEVQYPTSHIFDRGAFRDDYIERSGGLTANADRRRIYVVRADGSVETSSGSAFFRRRSTDMKPGDTVVVPMDTDRISPLGLWTNVSTVIYNIGVAAAAVASF